MEEYTLIIALIAAFCLDKLFGDPIWLPHPIVLFGKFIAFSEKKANKGKYRIFRGLIVVLVLVTGVFLGFLFLAKLSQKTHWSIDIFFNTIFIYFGLAGTTLIKEGQMVFEKLAIGLPEGRKQVARIVGRDTQQLSEQEIKAATLETMAENLSDGVIAPLFWFAIAGVPGIMAYKMVNTLDSMIGYKNDCYLYFGRCAALLDDVANYIPARITAFLMAFVGLKKKAFQFTIKYGKSHSSPNAGYPEAALAGILNAQFGGTHNYFGKKVEKPLIGKTPKKFTFKDFRVARRINILTELVFVVILVFIDYLFLSLNP